MHPKKEDLEQRIKAHWKELDRLITEHATVIGKASGLPASMLKQQFMSGQCLCQTAYQLCQDRKRDDELARKPAS
jgi:hypothetical protein